MAEIDERLSTYIDRIERFEDQMIDQPIIVSGSLENEILVDGDDDNIKKEPVLWGLYEHNMFYVVSVPPGSGIQKHDHRESVFRFIAQGSLILSSNSIDYSIKSGMWVTTHPCYQRHVRPERSEWPPAGCSPDSPWTADSLRCGNRLRRTFGCGSILRLSA